MEEEAQEQKKNDSAKRLSSIMLKDYLTLHQRARDGAFVVWVAIIVPVELFYGFENVVFAVPESHAAMSAGKGVGIIQAEKAEKMGYSTDLCSYARIDIGTAFDNGKDSPTMGLPRPNLLISNNNNCSLLVKWFDVYHREWDIPHFILDIPFCYETQKKEDREYIVDQFNLMIKKIEKLSGQKFDHQKAAKAVRNSIEASSYWKKFLGFAEQRPSGITAFDSFVQMAPILTSRGTPELVEHYRLLSEETAQRIVEKKFPVPHEKYRLLWDNIAPWHQLRKMSSRLSEMRANIVSASYTYCLGTIEGDYDIFHYKGSDPLEYLARIQNFSICPHGLELRYRAMEKAIRRLHIDGIIFASNRSCKVYSLMQMDQQKKVSEELKVPSVMIDIDHADSRKYSEESAFTRIEALLEKITAKSF